MKAALQLFALLLVGASLAFWLYLAHVLLPEPTGPYAVGTRILNLADPTRPLADGRPRPLVVQLWYPATPTGRLARYARWQETPPLQRYLALISTHAFLNAPFATADTPFPVLLFGHRWAGERTQNTALAEDLASHGYVVASIDHPGNSARILLPDGSVLRGTQDSGAQGLDGPEPQSASARIAWWNRNLQVWVADQESVLNSLAAASADPASPFSGRLDTQHAGAFGHSFGGAAALAMCGRDPRIRAAVNLDGYTFAALDHRTADQQVLILYEQVTGLSRNQPGGTPGDTIDDQQDRADTAIVQDSLHRFGGTMLALRGTQHMDFTDQPLLPPFHRNGSTGPIAPVRMDQLTRSLVLQFFNHALRAGPPVDLSTHSVPEQIGLPSR